MGHMALGYPDTRAIWVLVRLRAQDTRAHGHKELSLANPAFRRYKPGRYISLLGLTHSTILTFIFIGLTVFSMVHNMT